MTVIKKILTANVVCASFLLPGKTYAQYIERQVIASTGHSATLPILPLDSFGTHIDCTIGDIAVRSIRYPDEVLVTQGFQQPPLQGLLRLQKDEMLVFPNPTTDKITIMYKLEENVKKVDIRVITLGGHMVYTTTFIPQDGELMLKTVMDCTRFIPGIYVVTLIMDTGIKVSRKFVKFD
ncbi:T9SS type A sorting domain-containing protein [Chitinophaga sp. S165]|uniref:T9SS type A sorting domain-containing protein n=1 Tax=Chitinophaga sp. S165 TaxID=2135462 RepID=UPI000D71919C|nr:T9SS type A sorting domain-containing protein [Chitinophaga sp. S165]PWV56049.1 putative secreted protein (Por secretion system target) [Chitinophaga sp. S165]